MGLKIKLEFLKRNTVKVYVKNHGVTYAKNINDVGVAVSELLQTIKEREREHLKRLENE